jgi:hypothetical protein
MGVRIYMYVKIKMKYSLLLAIFITGIMILAAVFKIREKFEQKFCRSVKGSFETACKDCTLNFTSNKLKCSCKKNDKEWMSSEYEIKDYGAPVNACKGVLGGTSC